jgi:hypothetical protein
MKNFGTFWKIVLLTFTLALVLITSYTGWRIYDRKYGTCYWETSLSEHCYMVHYRDGRVKIFNNHTGKSTTPKLNWVSVGGDNHDSITVYRRGHKRGFLNRLTGEIIIPAAFDHAWNFSESLGAVVVGNRLGFIDIPSSMTIFPSKKMVLLSCRMEGNRNWHLMQRRWFNHLSMMKQNHYIIIPEK